MKPEHRLKKVAANLDVLRFPTPAEETVEPRCPHCSSPLAVHQPDQGLPLRKLGVCESCKYWYLIDLLIDRTEGIMVRLPETEVIREISRENPSAGISLISHDPPRGSHGPHQDRSN